MAGCMLDFATFAFRIRVTVKEYEKRTAARSNKRKWQQRSGIQALFTKDTIHLKVIKSRKHFMVSSILPKTNENHYPEHYREKLNIVNADLSFSKKLCKSYQGGRFGLLK